MWYITHKPLTTRYNLTNLGTTNTSTTSMITIIRENLTPPATPLVWSSPLHSDV